MARIKFTNKRMSKEALISLCFSAFTIIWTIIALNITYSMGEASPRVVGGISMSCFILEIAAIILAIKGFRDEEAFKQMPIAALIVAGILEVGLIFFFVLGIVLMNQG